MENYLYLLEIFVETVNFTTNIPENPKPSEVVISGEIGKFIKVDIFSMRHEDNTSNKQLSLNCGRSNLFSCANDELEGKLRDFPLTLSLTIKGQLMGRGTMKWEKPFFDLIKNSPESFGVTGPVKMEDTCIIKEKDTEKIMGDVKATVRLSSFGTVIQTSYQLVQPSKDANKKYLIRGARGDTTFECQKVDGSSSELLPVKPLFTTNPPSAEDTTINQSNYETDSLSWMALFKSSLDPKFSVSPEEFNVAISSVYGGQIKGKNASTITFDIVSIMERPDEHKFFDLRIRGGSQGFVFELDPRENILATEESLSSSEELEQSQTSFSEKLKRKLCKSKDCPYVKKFKEYGLGPLATVKNLGTLRADVIPPFSYGISQTYGVFDEYGPYGLFKTPKRPDNNFVSKKNEDWTKSCWKPKRKKEANTTTVSCCYGHYPPLRLTGGGLDFEDVKSPLNECKEIMNQFDEVLDKYKKAIGPCGKVTCPFAPNVIKETCKKVCQHPGEEFKIQDTIQFTLSGAPPEKVTSNILSKKNQLKGACGSPKCAYAKYKTGLTDEDAIMELQYLPSATSGRCGHPKCPVPVEPELPPIHWDCPDPLPKGRCKNPECPYLPKEIKCLNAVLGKGPCGNLNCPYTAPDPCPSPNCPFNPKECPYQQYQEKQETDENMCSNPECPFAEGDKNSSCENPSCPFATEKPSPCYMPQQEDICDNPECPFSKNTCPPQQSPCEPPPCYAAPCPGNFPSCPYSMNPYIQYLLAYCLGMSPCNPDLAKICFGGPDCPFTKKKSPPCPPPETCYNPSCPPGQGKQNVKTKRECGQNEDESSMCDNPECPYATKKPSPCYIPPTNEDICENPSCPYAEQEKFENACTEGDGKKQCYQKPPPCYVPPEEEEVCDNPDCPFAPPTSCSPPPCFQPPPCFPSPCFPPPCSSSPNTCGPTFPCPYGINPYLQALLASYLPLSICNDLNCPYTAKEINQFREILQMCFGGIECPTKKRETCITEEKVVKDDDMCDNPSCPYRQEGEVTSSDSKKQDEGPQEGGVEYHSETRTDVDNAPCQKGTCKAEGGDLVCDVCPCGQTPAEGELVEGATEYKSETREDIDLAPCTPKTCQSKGGKLVCDVCPCTATDKAIAKMPKKGKKARVIKGEKGKRKSKYVYSIGDKYPGVQIGHKQCVMPSCNVPKRMGWLWNIHIPCLQLKPRRGWRPGAIAKTIAARIRKHRELQGLQMLELKDFRKGKRGYGEYESEASIHVAPKPTLQIKKRDGCYWITMNPLKDPHTLVENESPYMDCTPMQFKIVKNKDKKLEGDSEYKTCFCGDDQDMESSSSESELDIEFTPPAGIIHPERFKRKRNVVHGETQYLTSDFEVKAQDKAGKGKKGKKGKKDKGKKGKGKGKKGKKK